MKTSITKKAYSRGIGEALQRQGVVQFPTQEFMKQASDQAAGFIQTEPSSNSVSDAECLKVAQHLVQINDSLRSRGKTASYPQNISIGQSAHSAIGDMITKVAEDVVSGGGSDGVTAVGVGDHSNTLQAAAGDTDIAAKELSERPEGYAQIMPGGGNIGESAAARIGQEVPMPGAPTTEGTNSVEQASAEKVAYARHLGGMSVDSVLADLARNR